MIFITEGMIDRYYISKVTICRPNTRRSDVADILISMGSRLDHLREAGLRAVVTVTIDRRVLVMVFASNFEYLLSERAKEKMKQHMSDFVSKLMRSTLEKIKKGNYYGLD